MGKYTCCPKCIIVMTLVSLLLPAYSMRAQTDREHYRRSSLTLILLTHKNKKYAGEMERIFRNFPLPARYNDHNINDVRVISVYGKQSRKDIDRLIRNNYVAQKVVARWFDRNPYSGRMDMDLIHERGGYGAFYDDYQRSQSNIRGASLLRDEGIELLQSSFVLVCDMDYIDKKKGAGWGAFGMALLSAGMQGMAQAQYHQAQRNAYYGNYSAAQNNYRNAQTWNAGSGLAMTGAAVVADIGGFRVKMNAYLYKLKWNDAMTETMYRDYWTDLNTSYSETQRRKEKFDDAKYYFALDFVGQYKTTSSKTILRSWSDEDEVILDVCKRCVDKGMRALAKKFVVFRPRTPFYFDGGMVYSHIGRKEEVTYGRKYEIIQPYKDKHGVVQYKRVGKATAGYPWNNLNIRFDEYFDNSQKGTVFYCGKSSVDLHIPGLQLREL